MMLILDLSLYPENSAIRAVLGNIGAEGDTDTLLLDVDAMSADDWDGLLEKILAADKCLTV